MGPVHASNNLKAALKPILACSQTYFVQTKMRNCVVLNHIGLDLVRRYAEYLRN